MMLCCPMGETTPGYRSGRRNRKARKKPTTSAIMMLTNGPANAIINSCLGLAGILTNRAMPPIGVKTMSNVFIPNRRATSAWPYSCSTTQQKTVKSNRKETNR